MGEIRIGVTDRLGKFNEDRWTGSTSTSLVLCSEGRV